MISFIIPAFNEEKSITDAVETIKDVTQRLCLRDYEIIIINDGSSDKTPQIITALAEKDACIKTIHHTENMGLGKSLKDGIHAATKPKFAVVPGDNDIDTDSLMLMLRFMETADLLFTLPLNKEIRPFFRQLLSTIYQTAHIAMFGVPVGYLNGPGIWPTEKVKKLDLKSNRFSIISEMNVRLFRTGLSFAEVPIYFQASAPERSTVTVKNLLEVLKIFFFLIYDLKLNPRAPKMKPSHRVQINFARLMEQAGKKAA